MIGRGFARRGTSPSRPRGRAESLRRSEPLDEALGEIVQDALEARLLMREVEARVLGHPVFQVETGDEKRMDRFRDFVFHASVPLWG